MTLSRKACRTSNQTMQMPTSAAGGVSKGGWRFFDAIQKLCASTHAFRDESSELIPDVFQSSRITVVDAVAELFVE